MIIRKFKPGDWVVHKLGGPVMQVIRYEIERKLLVGEIVSREDVKCVWYEAGERKTAVFNQRTLKKALASKGIYKT